MLGSGEISGRVAGLDGDADTTALGDAGAGVLATADGAVDAAGVLQPISPTRKMSAAQRPRGCCFIAGLLRTRRRRDRRRRGPKLALDNTPDRASCNRMRSIVCLSTPRIGHGGGPHPPRSALHRRNT